MAPRFTRLSAIGEGGKSGDCGGYSELDCSTFKPIVEGDKIGTDALAYRQMNSVAGPEARF